MATGLTAQFDTPIHPDIAIVMTTRHRGSVSSRSSARAASSLFCGIVLVLLIVPRIAEAQYGYGISDFVFRVGHQMVPESTPLEAGQQFELSYALYVSGTLNNDPHPAGSITIDFDGASFVGLAVPPPASGPLSDLTCTGTDPVECSWAEFSSQAFVVGLGILVDAPSPPEETTITVSGSVAPADGGFPDGVGPMQDVMLTVMADQNATPDLTMSCTPTSKTASAAVPEIYHGEIVSLICTFELSGSDIVGTVDFSLEETGYQLLELEGPVGWECNLFSAACSVAGLSSGSLGHLQ